MSEYILHCFNKSGNAYKVALMLSLSSADWKPLFVDYMSGETRSEKFREINPMGEIPLLEHKGLTLSQSGVILDYLAETLGTFGPQNETERREILRWILFDNHKLTSYTATLRFIRALTDQGEGEVTVFLEARSKAALKILNNHLKQSDFAIGNRPPSLIYLCAAIYIFKMKLASILQVTQTSIDGLKILKIWMVGPILMILCLESKT